ncbi:MAG: hypothetical protein LC800_20165 [Acidobacteria bacterium]|nr:hypothetical protein [Acidobacteriota bacterium]
MSDDDRRKKDGERKDGDARRMHEAVAERKSGQEPAVLPKDKSNHLIGDDEPVTEGDERR